MKHTGNNRGIIVESCKNNIYRVDNTKETSLRRVSFSVVLTTGERGKKMGESTTYYISEAAKKIQVENHVLRYWEEELKLPIRRNEMGHRYYTEEDINKLKEIKRLKEQGLQLKAIKTILLEGENGIQDIPQKFVVTLSKQNKEESVNTTPRAESVPQPKSVPQVAVQTKVQAEKAQSTAEKTQPTVETQEAQSTAEKAQPAAGQGKVQAMERTKKAQAKTQPQVKPVQEEKTRMVIASPQVEVTEPEPAMDKREKAARLQYLLQHMITEAVKSANQELCTDVKESILKELDYQFRMQEERDDERWKKEEEHYRKIDEMIRERHNVVKEKGKKSKRKSPIGI